VESDKTGAKSLNFRKSTAEKATVTGIKAVVLKII
jgi:hypothetical protein